MNEERLGNLPPQYNFFLNPYDDQRYTHCPKCDAKTRQRKLPLLFWIEPNHPVSLNYTCVYCLVCDLLIAHKNEIENYLAQIFLEQAPKSIGNPYIVLGTMDKPAWKRGTQGALDINEMLEFLHDFKQVLKFEPVYASGLPESVHNELIPQTNSVQASIDNPLKTTTLVEKMKISLPIAARPTNGLVKILRKRGIRIDRYREIQIKSVFYAGDEGGITCDITPPDMEKTPILCSITHLLIRPGHPLFDEIRIYQTERENKLAKKWD